MPESRLQICSHLLSRSRSHHSVPNPVHPSSAALRRSRSTLLYDKKLFTIFTKIWWFGQYCNLMFFITFELLIITTQNVGCNWIIIISIYNLNLKSIKMLQKLLTIFYQIFSRIWRFLTIWQLCSFYNFWTAYQINSKF